MQSKKGAIELSMTTIIVIVLGVTLLILGLVFVRGIFEKVTKTATRSFEIADKELQDRMGASDRAYIPGVDFEVESGGSTTITVGVQNFGDETTASQFRVDVTPGEGNGSRSWFQPLPPPQSLRPGETKGFPLKVKLPDGVPPGKSYSFLITVNKGQEVWDTQAIIVSVREE